MAKAWNRQTRAARQAESGWVWGYHALHATRLRVPSSQLPIASWQRLLSSVHILPLFPEPLKRRVGGRVAKMVVVAGGDAGAELGAAHDGVE